ncbi:MAG: class I SAM-dependent methyltransferase [Bdellovibrionales bacterium]|nr:class I SAM-dependent methyltransferase [Bdellovibrionales bacterium]
MNNQEEIHRQSYDEVPYVSYAYHNSSPAYLEALGRLFQIDIVPVSACRVLELGCATGGNLLPVAALFPKSHFVGVDFSAKQIAIAKSHLEHLSLKNVTFYEQDLCTITKEFGSFDYIIAHGLYSWLPDHVRGELLRVIGECLAPNGMAYVSYNTYPGWATTQALRYAMRFQGAGHQDPTKRVQAALGILQFLGDSLPNQESAYAQVIREHIDSFQRIKASHFLHDHLEEFNTPTYFLDFVKELEPHNLRYLADADLGSMSVMRYPKEVQEKLRALSGGEVHRMEQYIDFLVNRSFRASLIVHPTQKPIRTLDPKAFPDLFIASALKLDSDLNLNNPSTTAKFVSSNKQFVVEIKSHVGKGVLSVLSQKWPQALSTSELLSALSKEFSAHSLSPTIKREEMNGVLLQLFLEGALLLRSNLGELEQSSSGNPIAQPIARLYATFVDKVPNLYHQSVPLNDLNRAILSLLDGEKDAEAIATELTEKGALKKRDESGNLSLKEAQSVVDGALLKLKEYGFLLS